MCSDKIEEILENVVDSLCLRSSVQQSQNDSKQYCCEDCGYVYVLVGVARLAPDFQVLCILKYVSFFKVFFKSFE